jgi:hypothetical protein
MNSWKKRLFSTPETHTIEICPPFSKFDLLCHVLNAACSSHHHKTKTTNHALHIQDCRFGISMYSFY